MKLVWLFIGPPGSGKGTQAKKLVEEGEFEHVSTGDLLRAEIASGSELGQQIKSIVDQGQLVSDDIMIRLIEGHLKKNSLKTTVILDGFPRTVKQGEALIERATQGSFQLAGVFYFKVPNDVLVERASLRLVCGQCGAIFHQRSKRPKKEGVCDHCGGPLMRRPDDAPEVVSKRIEVYQNQTQPLLDFFKRQSKVYEIDGAQDENSIFVSLLKTLKNK